MKFTFGIITSSGSNQWIPKIIDSIVKLNILEYEILIIGDSGINQLGSHVNATMHKNFTIELPIKYIDFDESIKDKWITRKKNLITENAKYDNIVYTHDYHIFDDNWYQGFLKFGEDFKVCSNIIINDDGSRYRDWMWWDWPGAKYSHNDQISIPNSEHLLPYTEARCSRWMYINGSYWVAKKEVMMEFPLNENLAHGGMEDIEWSKRVSSKYKFSMNVNSSIKMLKHHDVYWKPMSDSTYNNILIPFLNRNGIA
jgi:hypothetical protein